MVETAVDWLAHERALLARGESVVGLDEVGRGALAGPVCVGAVVIVSAALPPLGLNDSKALTARSRDALVAPLRTWAAGWSIGSASPSEIDRWGLRLALALAATRALDTLVVAPTHALIDGPINLLRAPRDVALDRDPPPLAYATLPATTLVRGDQRSAVIAAAAVLAKVHRDAVMTELARRCEGYHWASNKGYGAPAHLAAIRDRGPSSEHRMSWRLPTSRSA